ncbi:MAG: YhcH/YjgK/YiaL family protein [Acetivibrionales bacterium]|jgi:biofilm protein TabA
MIIDILDNWEQYASLGDRFNKAFKFLAESDPDKIAIGRHDIVSGEVYANVREYDVQEGGDIKLESHRRYADIQYVFKGTEIIGYAVTGEGETIEEYNSEKDVIFYKGPFEALTLREGKFAVFFPGDAHAVRISPSGGSHIKKAVVKVLLD